MQDQDKLFGNPLVPQHGVLVVDGYGIKLYVHRGHLQVEDGIGPWRRRASFARATAGIRRLILLGASGFVSLEAIRWLEGIGASLIHLGRDGRLLAVSGSLGLDDPRLRRAQALAMTNGTGIEVARMLIQEKVSGQRAVLEGIADSARARSEVDRCFRSVECARSLDAVLVAEAAAASAYWSAWEHVPVTFARRYAGRIPSHWLTFGKRSSPLTGQPRLAANPANAMLNYLYALLEAESTIACLAVGLDSGLGILHADQRARDSLALDLMEAARPAVDRYLFQLVTDRVLVARQFRETRQGACRILPPLTHDLAQTARTSAACLGPIAERIARMLAESPGSRISRVTTPLTQTNRSTGRDEIRRRPKREKVPMPVPPRACRMCGLVLESAGRWYCAICRPKRRAETVGPFQTAGPAAVARSRAQGRDPSKTETALRKIGSKIALRNRERAEWDKRHDGWDPEDFRRTILPLLQNVPLSRLSKATGLSLMYCSRIRRGLKVPHPRHWGPLKGTGRALEG